MLSVIITALNENNFLLNRTILTLREGNKNIEIIVIDDCSDSPVFIFDKDVKLIRNEQRIGCAQSRHKGALLAKNEWLLFTDAHMLFQKDWFDGFLSYKLTDKTVLCGTCLGLDERSHNTLDKSAGEYNGARLALYEKDENQILEGKWIGNKDGDFYDLSCLMGAIYLIKKEYFLYLKGFSELKMWGSDEPCLSLKVLLSGGNIKIAKKIRAGHVFRGNSPYSTETKYLTYNKIRMALSLLPDDLANNLIQKLPKNPDFFGALEIIKQEEQDIIKHKEYYKSIFTKDIYSVCKKNDIKLP